MLVVGGWLVLGSPVPDDSRSVSSPAGLLASSGLGPELADAAALPAPETPAPSPDLRVSDSMTLRIASLDEFASDASLYLDSREPQWGVALALPAQGVVYESNGRQPFALASVTKVLILAMVLEQADAAGRELDAFDHELLAWMITESSNEAAIILWEQAGGTEALATFIREHQLGGIFPPVDGLSWGDTSATALGLSQMLVKLQSGQLLSPESTSYALELMTTVLEDQRWGLPLAFADSQAVALKNGWYPAITGWRVNSLAIDLSNGSPAIFVMLTRNQSSMEYAVETIEGVAREVGAALRGESGTQGARIITHAGSTTQVSFAPRAEGLPEVDGECIGSSIEVRRFGAWICTTTDGETFDPCFSNEADAGVVVCGASPGSDGGFALRYSVELPFADQRPRNSMPWVVTLEDGTNCTALRTEPLNEDGDRVSYECGDGSLLIGPLQRSEVFYALRADQFLQNMTTVRIERAWF